MLSRQEKSKQLANLQSELQLLDSDIKQVAGRHPALPASHAKSPQLQLPSRQHNTQLLNKRLQEDMPSLHYTANRNKQTAAASAAHITDGRPAVMAAVASLQPVQMSAGVRPRPSGSLPPASFTTALPPTSVLSAQQHLMQSSQLSTHTHQSSTQPGIILAQPCLSHQPTSDQDRQQPGTIVAIAASSDQSLQPHLTRASNGYLMINHPYPTPSLASQHQGTDGNGMATASMHGSSASATPTATRSATPVPIPTQMERQQSMHIHPRHLAFQHFHAQQQQRQQMERQNSVSHAATASGAAATEDQAATQEAALGYLARLLYDICSGTVLNHDPDFEYVH